MRKVEIFTQSVSVTIKNKKETNINNLPTPNREEIGKIKKFKTTSQIRHVYHTVPMSDNFLPVFTVLEICEEM